MSRAILIFAALALLTSCKSWQTGRALNVFDSESFWCSGHGCDKPAGGEDGNSPDHPGASDSVSH